MTKKSDTIFIINPHSCNCKTGKLWHSLEKEIRSCIGDFQYEFTRCPCDATTITRKALNEGYKLIVSVGGDGTVNEVVNGFFEGETLINAEASLAIFNCGTGGDLRKTLNMCNKLKETIDIIKNGKTIKIDLGLMEFKDLQGNTASRFFANIADFGMGGEVAVRVNRTTKMFGGLVSYFWALLRAGISYRNKLTKLIIDNSIEREVRIKNVIVANGQYFGGGMRIASRASISDGLFDIVIIGDFTLWESIKEVKRIYTGELYGLNKVEYYRGKELTAIPIDEPILIDMDGENPGMLPATFKIIPQILNIRVDKGFVVSS